MTENIYANAGPRTAEASLAQLAALAGLPAEAAQAAQAVEIEGRGPVFPTRYDIVTPAAAVLAATGLAAADRGSSRPGDSNAFECTRAQPRRRCAARAIRRAREGGSWVVRTSLASAGYWIREHGLLEPAQYSDLPSELPADELASLLAEHDSPIGRLTHLAPVVQMSETQPRWARPAVPRGYHRAAWP